MVYGASFQSTMALNDNQWHHIALTSSGSNYKLYVDGSLNNSATLTSFRVWYENFETIAFMYYNFHYNRHILLYIYFTIIKKVIAEIYKIQQINFFFIYLILHFAIQYLFVDTLLLFWHNISLNCPQRINKVSFCSLITF